MEHIHTFRTGIMAEYLVMSTLQGTYGRTEQNVVRDKRYTKYGGGDWDWETLL